MNKSSGVSPRSPWRNRALSVVATPPLWAQALCSVVSSAAAAAALVGVTFALYFCFGECDDPAPLALTIGVILTVLAAVGATVAMVFDQWRLVAIRVQCLLVIAIVCAAELLSEEAEDSWILTVMPLTAGSIATITWRKWPEAIAWIGAAVVVAAKWRLFEA